MMERNTYARNAKGAGFMGRRERTELPPPCRICYQVADPAECENKHCKVWRQWFISQWDAQRKQLLQALGQSTPVGGRDYHHPNYLKRYLDKDPCKVCRIAQCKCTEPCPFRRN